MIKDYYRILDVDRLSKAKDIKSAYRKKSLLLHPDVNRSPEANQQFHELHEAYQVLSNPLRRTQYNQLYDHDILQKSWRNESRFERKRPVWEDRVQKTAERGQRRASRQSDVDLEQLKNSLNHQGLLGELDRFVTAIGQFLLKILEFFFFVFFRWWI